MITARHVLALLTLPLAACGAAAPKVSPADAARLVAEGKAVLVDCREPKEWAATGVADPAVLLPKSDFDAKQEQWREFLARNQGKQILVYCRSGGRSGTIAQALVKEGVNAANVGGMKDWTAAGLPTRTVAAPKTESKPAAKK